MRRLSEEVDKTHIKESSISLIVEEVIKFMCNPTRKQIGWTGNGKPFFGVLLEHRDVKHKATSNFLKTLNGDAPDSKGLVLYPNNIYLYDALKDYLNSDSDKERFG